MTYPRQYQLIDGTFTPDEARQVLRSMVKSKIDFHTLAIHSEDERSGRTDDPSEKRLRVLRGIEAQMKDICESAQTKGVNLKLQGVIEIVMEE